MFARRKRDVEAALVRIKEDYISLWLLYFASGKDYQFNTYDGQILIIPGKGKFDGKILESFWRNVEGLLENTIVEIIAQAEDDVRTFSGRFQRKHLDETRYLLQEKLVRGVYDDMQTTDQNLRGKGNPRKVTLKNVEEYLNRFDEFVEGQVHASLSMVGRTRRRGMFKSFMLFFAGALFMFVLLLVDQVMGHRRAALEAAGDTKDETPGFFDSFGSDSDDDAEDESEEEDADDEDTTEDPFVEDEESEEDSEDESDSEEAEEDSDEDESDEEDADEKEEEDEPEEGSFFSRLKR